MKKLSEKELDEMIEEATVDCYNEDEAFAGILVTIEDNLSFPFKAKALGDDVEVIGIDNIKSSLGRGIVANVKKQGKMFTIGLSELEIEQDEENSKWIQMFHHWDSRY
ncbi:hypothetical protein GF312_15795 [Candidatus Poribacteria bacterium]|nr:hypothetical protein [Candidatus Poribacteria bacterium]